MHGRRGGGGVLICCLPSSFDQRLRLSFEKGGDWDSRLSRPSDSLRSVGFTPTKPKRADMFFLYYRVFGVTPMLI